MEEVGQVLCADFPVILCSLYFEKDRCRWL